jgi:hypothetical protein
MALIFVFESLPLFLYFVLVLLLELAFRLHPVVQVATVNSAAFDVNLKRSLTDFRWGRPVVASFFWDVRLNTSWHVLSICG